MSTPSAAKDVVDFWKASADHWFVKSDEFDKNFTQRYTKLYNEVKALNHEDWLEDPQAALALIILTDQFPRNAFRGTPQMYATDEQALSYAKTALDAGFWEKTEEKLRLFLTTPFMHSEGLEDQARSVELNRRLGGQSEHFAKEHEDIIKKFGRFPHRNPIVGRETTEAEQKFLDDGGFKG